MKRCVALWVVCAVWSLAASASAHSARFQDSIATDSTGRVRLNFNADWRFKVGQSEGAQQPNFDDSAWESVGLPHSFSIPYFRASAFYTGDGWYRKAFTLEALAPRRRLSFEFEGAFQDAVVYVNGTELAHHRGGYTGFSVDITDAVRTGRNVVAVRVNNDWSPTLAPRAGEHVFSGGLYRDVWFVATDAVHVTWTGTRVTTPELSQASGKVAIETEVRNDGAAPVDAAVRTQVIDAKGKRIANLPEQHLTLEPVSVQTVRQISSTISKPRLWSPETPVLYRVVSSVYVDGKERDRFETPFGFRWFEWTANRGFFLNGEHRYFKGANVHQDQAGWGDAVTNRAIERDVQMIKDAGFDFIRGSHYPHDPHFAESTDRIGLLFLSEAPFWGTAPFKNPWGASAYPTDPADRAAFEASVKQQLAEMIRINRNHPSIVVWGMDNEVFFTAQDTLPEVRRFLKDLVALSHELDPTRPAAIDGAQRGDIDKLGDIAGYNGDGAQLFPNPGVPNFVAEYGSTMVDRPGEYLAGFGDLPKTPGANEQEEGSWRLPWRSGEVLWCGFDHGSIAGKKFGGMGMIDYQRLPKRQWYWYRDHYAHVPPPSWPQQGTPAALRIITSAPTIARADGTDDVQVVVSVVDGKGQRVSNSPPVRLAIEAGPGELPTGRAIEFAPDTDIEIRDGEAAIAMRSWQKGVTKLRATSPGLKDGVAEIRTLDGPAFEVGTTRLASEHQYVAFGFGTREQTGDGVFGLNNPTDASSSASDHSARFVNDGNSTTYWAPTSDDKTMSVTIDTERLIEIHRLMLTFPQAAAYGFVAETQDAQGHWLKLADVSAGAEVSQSRTVETQSIEGRKVRIQLRVPTGAVAGLAEMRVSGTLRNN